MRQFRGVREWDGGGGEWGACSDSSRSQNQWVRTIERGHNMD